MDQPVEQRLIEAVYKKDYRTVRECLEGNPDLNALAPDTPLKWKTYPPNDKGLVVSVPDYEQDNTPCYVSGKTALFVAVENNDVEMVRILLKAGADPNVPVKSGLYPLNVSAETRTRDDITELLLEHGADPNVRSPIDNRTPLISRAGLGQQFRMVNLFIQKGADPFATDIRGRSALGIAREHLRKCEPINSETMQRDFFMTSHPRLALEAVQDEIETRKTISLLRTVMGKRAP